MRIDRSISVKETLTNNVDLQPSASARSDLVSEITPQIGIDAKGPRSSLRGSIAVPIVLYARTGAEHNKVYPAVTLNGSVEAIEKLFFIEASVAASQQFLDPLGQRPADLASATDNRFTSVVYRVSPYLQGVAAGDIRYLLRYNAVWSNLNSVAADVSNGNYGEWIGRLESPVTPYGWGLEFNRTEVKFDIQDPQITQLFRARARYQFDPQLQVSASAGYEDNQYPSRDYSGAIYGVEVIWRPTERTNALANWEHRFFGSSYLLSVDHRTPLSVWSARSSRDITTYAQQVAALPAGGNVQGLLNDLLTTSIPDPVARQTAVDRLIQDRGLPQSLASPINLYSQQVLLRQYQSATMGLLGANNTVFVTLFNNKTEPIAGSGNVLPTTLAISGNSTQRGGDVTWTYRLSPFSNLITAAGAGRTSALEGTTSDSRTKFVRVGMTSRISASTTVIAGARYQNQNSNFGNGYSETAVYAGFNSVFR